MVQYRIQVVNLRNCPDFGKRPGDFRIDRTSRWGNPYELKNRTRDQCVDLYESYFCEKLLKDISQLATANRLGCWCAPARCHGDVIKKYLIKYLDGLERQMTLDGKVLYYKDPKR